MSTRDEAKRLSNIERQELDFAECDAIWDNFTITSEDVRQDYGEKRLVTFGLLHGAVAVLVYLDRRKEPHIISLRKAEKHEARCYFEIAKDHFKQAHRPGQSALVGGNAWATRTQARSRAAEGPDQSSYDRAP